MAAGSQSASSTSFGPLAEPLLDPHIPDIAETSPVIIEEVAEEQSAARVARSLDVLSEFSEQAHPGHQPGRFAGPGAEYDGMEFDGQKWHLKAGDAEAADGCSALAKLSDEDRALATRFEAEGGLALCLCNAFKMSDQMRSEARELLEGEVPQAELERLLLYGSPRQEPSAPPPDGSGPTAVEQAMVLLQAADLVEERESLMRNVWADVEFEKGDLGNAELVSRLEMQLAGQIVRTAEERLRVRCVADDGLFGPQAQPQPRPEQPQQPGPPAGGRASPSAGAPATAAPAQGGDGLFQVVLRGSEAASGLVDRLPADELAATLATPRNLGAALDLVGAYLKNYEIDKADMVLERAVPLCREKGGIWLVKGLDKLCAVRMKQHRAYDALVALKEIEQLVPFSPQDGWEFHDILFRNFAWCYASLDEAERCLEYTMKSAEVKRACGVPSTWFDIWDLGKSHARLGQKTNQLEEMRIGYDLCVKAGEIHRRAEPQDRIMLAKILSNVGEVAMGIGDSHHMGGNLSEADRWYREAEGPLRESYELHSGCLGPLKPLSGWQAGTVAHCMVRLERWEEARDYLALALKVECTKDSTTPGAVIELLERVLSVHTELGDHKSMQAYAADLEGCLSSLRNRGWDRRERDVFGMLLHRVATVFLVIDGGSGRMAPAAVRILREAEANLEIFIRESQGNGSLRCQDCGKAFEEERELQAHVERRHRGNHQDSPDGVDLSPKQFGPRPGNPAELLQQIRQNIKVLTLGGLAHAGPATATGESGPDAAGDLQALDTALGRGRSAEADHVALGRTYALVGSWSQWQRFDDLTRTPQADGRVLFVAEVLVPAGQDVEFQVICNCDWGQRMFPAVGGCGAGGGTVLGPSPDGHGRNWRLRAPRQPSSGAMLRVQLDPTGERSLECRLELVQAPPLSSR